MSTPEKHMHMPFADYCDLDAVNASTLLTYGHINNVYGKPTPSIVPAKARYAQIHGQPETDALVIGHASHAALLEPDTYEAEYRTQPTAAQFGFGDFRKKEAREARDKWLEEHKDAICLSDQEHQMACTVRDSVLSNPDSACMFTGKGSNEVTFTWTDQKTGLPCKARIDRFTTYHGLPALIDLKTTQRADCWEASRAVARYSYHVRMAWYMDCLNLYHKANWWVLLVWVEKAKPYLVHITQLSEDALKEGRAQYRALLNLHAQCLEAGEWPEYPEAPDVLDIPQWAYNLTAPGTMR